MDEHCEKCDHPVARPFSLKAFAAALALVFALYVVLQKLGVFSLAPDIGGTLGLGALFLIGFFAAFSSCGGVVSGFIAASAANGEGGIQPHVLFHVGRVMGFFILGVFLGYAGALFSFSPLFNGFLLLGLSVVMLLLGFDLMGVLPAKLAPRLPKKLSAAAGSSSPFFLGALTFFLPCGFTQAAQFFALSTGNPLFSGVIMAVFALGGVPSLLGLSAVSLKFSGTRATYMKRAIGVFVALVGLVNLSAGATLTGVTAYLQAAALPRTETVLVDGAQLIQMEITPYGYAPQVIEVVEGVPVTWEIYAMERLGCANTLVSPALGLHERIVPGLNTIGFTPEQSGVYTFSCSMGMVSGTLVVKSPNT